MVGAHEKVAARNCHVPSQLSFDGKVRLIRVRVFKILLDVQRERKHRSESGERLVVEPLPSKLVLRGRGGTWRRKAGRTQRIYARRGTYCSLKDLSRVKQSGGRRTSLRCQD